MIRAVLILDVMLFRKALAAALTTADVTVVCELSCADVNRIEDLPEPPDIVVVDFDARHAAAFAAVRAVNRQFPGCRVLGLVRTAAPANLRRALDARVLGFVSKENEPETVLAAIRTVAAGERYIEPRLGVAALSRPPNPLTARELEILRLVAEGLPIADIAARLFLSAGTVRNYLSTIVHKVGARNRIEALRTAEEASWL